MLSEFTCMHEPVLSSQLDLTPRSGAQRGEPPFKLSMV
jgi:hypothetical protein